MVDFICICVVLKLIVFLKLLFIFIDKFVKLFCFVILVKSVKCIDVFLLVGGIDINFVMGRLRLWYLVMKLLMFVGSILVFCGFFLVFI